VDAAGAHHDAVAEGEEQLAAARDDGAARVREVPLVGLLEQREALQPFAVETVEVGREAVLEGNDRDLVAHAARIRRPTRVGMRLLAYEPAQGWAKRRFWRKIPATSVR